jgi:imidazole glycerol phosphate synthase subunit HisF
MASKRLVGVIAVKNGLVVKSYGYRFWRPAGRLLTALKNLDRWLVDEILILDVSRRPSPDPAVVEEIRASRISTPLAYGGGIQTQDNVDALLAAGCERFVLETMLFKFPERVQSLADKVGAQALIASLPLVSKNTGRWQVDCDYAAVWGRDGTELNADSLSEFCNTLPVAEVLAIDTANEGPAGGFSLLASDGTHPFAALRKGVIWFGGIDAVLAAKLLEMSATVAVAFGNVNFEREVAMRTLRRYVLRNCSIGIARRTS